MTAGIHPPIHNGGGCPISIGNVFTCGPVGEAKGLNHLEGSAIGGAGMGKVPVARSFPTMFYHPIVVYEVGCGRLHFCHGLGSAQLRKTVFSFDMLSTGWAQAPFRHR